MTALDLAAIKARAATITADTDKRYPAIDLADRVNVRDLLADGLALVAEVERLQAFVDDLAWNGIRFDLNPTVDLQNMGRAYTGYLERIDASIRSRAGRHSSDPAPSATSGKEPTA